MRWKTCMVLIAIGMGGAGAAQAKEPDQFDALRQHLFSGQRTTSILQLDKCEQTSGKKLPLKGFSGGFVIPAFLSLQQPEEVIVYSDDHSTVRDDTPVHEFIRYRVVPDEMATVTMKVFSSKTHDPIGETRIFKCILGDGLSFAYGGDR